MTLADPCPKKNPQDDGLGEDFVEYVRCIVERSHLLKNALKNAGVEPPAAASDRLDVALDRFVSEGHTGDVSGETLSEMIVAIEKWNAAVESLVKQVRS